jgi:predicted dehydrogenase
MIRLALIGGLDRAAAYERIAPRLGDVQITPLAEEDAADSLARRAAEFDALVIDSAASPMELAQRASAAGKHVLLKSPGLAATSTLDDLASAVARAKTRLMWGRPLRFLPAARTVKENLSAGRLGVPGLVRLHHWEPVEAATDGDGALASRLLAQLDLVCWLFDSRPEVVYASGQAAPDTARRYLQVHLGFAGDGMALLDYAALPAGDDYFSLSLIGSSGAAYADDHHNMQLVLGPQGPQAVKTDAGDLPLLAQLKEFLAAIADAREPQPGLAELRRAGEVAARVAQSLETGQAVSDSGE